MLVTQAREFLEEGVLHTKKNAWSDIQKDMALLTAINYLLRKTKITRTTTTIATVASTATIDFSTPVGAQLHSANIIEVRHASGQDYKEIVVSDKDTVLGWHQDGNTSEDVTTHIWFDTEKSAFVRPLPADAYTLTVKYWLPAMLEEDDGDLFEWEPGIAKKGRINVPDYLLYETISLGAAAVLTANEKSNPWQSRNWQRFEKFVRETKGKMRPGRMDLKASDYE